MLIARIGLTLIVSHLIGDVHCPTFSTVMEGENVTMDCGFQTTVDGGNLLWKSISTNGSETDLGHIVPGDHFCGTDNLNCTVHTNGSITLKNVTMDDGNKRYYCLRGDEKGYHYVSYVNLIVLKKESLGHPVIQPLTESKANVYMIEEKSVIHSYKEPTCEDKEDGALIVTCFPPSGVIVDKVYHQVHCICTDSDGNSNSLNITVNSKGGSKHDEGRQLNEETDHVSQRLNDKEAECRDNSDEIVKLKEENQNKVMTGKMEMMSR